jgi:hypothetical protein
MTYACPASEFAAVNHLLKLQRLQNNVLRTIGNFPMRTPVRDLHMTFKLPYIGQGEPSHRKYKRLELGGDQATTFK